MQSNYNYFYTHKIYLKDYIKKDNPHEEIEIPEVQAG